MSRCPSVSLLALSVLVCLHAGRAHAVVGGPELAPVSPAEIAAIVEAVKPPLLNQRAVDRADARQTETWVPFASRALTQCATAYRGVHSMTVAATVGKPATDPSVVAREATLARIAAVCDAWENYVVAWYAAYERTHQGIPARAGDLLAEYIDKEKGGAEKRAREAAIAATPGGNPWWAEDMADAAQVAWIKAEAHATFDLIHRELQPLFDLAKEMDTLKKPRPSGTL